MDAPWWQSAVFYQIYPRSFAVSGPGRPHGDLAGIEARLDHLSWLGVDAVWLSPFYRSPMDDFGYDVADHCDVDPTFGTLDDFDRLVESCHRRGLRLLVDFVPNHTSDQHPWFQAARSSRDDPHRDWYVWRDGTPDTPPNNWRAAFTDGPAWTWDEATGQWYLHLFLPSQPDLDWSRPAVREAMHDVVRFWLDRGVDGFRVDVVHCLGKDPALPDNPPEIAAIPHSALNDVPLTHERIRELRRLVDSYPGDRLLLGEVYLLDTDRVATYYGAGDELHLSFNFPPMYAPWSARRWRRQIDRTRQAIDGRGAWPTWVLSNHDNQRHRTRYGGSEARARAAAFILLGLRGSPVLYAGEEIGLEDAIVPPERQLDPGGRDGCRAPIPWSGDPDHGWFSPDQWLPWPPEADRRNVAAQRADERSILHLYRRLLTARRKSTALQLGDFAWLDAPEDVLAWRRRDDAGERIVVVNMGGEPAEVPVTGTVVVASDGVGEGEPFAGTLAGDTAVLLAP